MSLWKKGKLELPGAFLFYTLDENYTLPLIFLLCNIRKNIANTDAEVNIIIHFLCLLKFICNCKRASGKRHRYREAHPCDRKSQIQVCVSGRHDSHQDWCKVVCLACSGYYVSPTHICIIPVPWRTHALYPSKHLNAFS